MPLHVYYCKQGHVTEIVEAANEDKPKKCATCGAKATIGVAQTAPPIFKRGCGGFYKPNAD